MKSFVSVFYVLLGQAVAHGAVVYGLSSSYDADLDLYAPSHLFRFSLHGETFVDLGPVLLDGAGADLDGLAASQEFGLVSFQNTPAGSRFAQIDPVTVTATLLSPPLFSREIRGAAFSAAGTLWALDANLDELVRVSSTTGEELDSIALSLDSLPFDVPLATDLAFNFSGELLLVAERDVYVVDPDTGVMTALFADNQGEPMPASMAPPTLVGAVVGFAEAEKLFGFDVEGALADDVYTYDLTSDFARELLFVGPLPQIDTGLGDLALLLEPVDSGDYNGDGVVDAADYTVWRDTRGSTDVLLANGDDSGTSMSIIDEADYDLWVSKFGNTAVTASNGPVSASVPEPAHLLLLMLVPLGWKVWA